ncbi:MAG: EAL domain-containing protein [Myxococcales bacterium]|nr:EAL domain-containing protein [Myxococcales bacterium]
MFHHSRARPVPAAPEGAAVREAVEPPSSDAALHAHSNRLSDSPTASRPLDEDEARFFGMVSPSDLSAVFQPIVSLETGTTFAYEALVRCRIPNFTPSVLFERAAELRSTGRLGRMIREMAVTLCAGTPLFVNLHPNELEEGWLVRPDDPVFSHDDDIFLEITESAPMTHFDLCASVLREVCARAGMHLAIDDLGTGYSNLNLIADLEPDVVKLDRALVTALDRKPRQQKVVSTIVRLCAELGAVVVAEGIETNDELSAVRDCGAQFGQGFLLARPCFPPPAVTWPAADDPPGERSPPTMTSIRRARRW